MNVYKASLFTLISSLMFAAMSSLVRFAGETAPVGQVVFFRAAFGIVPITLFVLFRGELLQMIRTHRVLGHAGRGMFSVGGMFLNFASGLVLYWLVNNIFGILQQFFVNRKTRRLAEQTAGA